MKKLSADELAKALLDGNYKGIYARFSQPLKDALSEVELARAGEEFKKDIHTMEKTSILQLNGFDRRIWVSDARKTSLSPCRAKQSKPLISPLKARVSSYKPRYTIFL